MRTLFIDTNVLLQCLDLENIAWHQFANDQNLLLLISRPVQEEIDRMKQDGNTRRARRSRNATAFIRRMISAEDSRVAVRESNPHVEVGFAPPVIIKETNFPFLDLTRPDDRIIAEALMYRTEHIGEDVAILTHDTQPILMAKNCGLSVFIVPDEWLLPPEPDARDKKITELERKLKDLERSYPEILVVSNNEKGIPSQVLKLSVQCYAGMSDQQIEELVGLAARRYPLVTEFDLSKPKMRALGPTGLGTRRRYEPPSEEEIRKYKIEQYPEWVQRIRDFFKTLPPRLEDLSRLLRFTISISNIGSAPAENFLVEFNAYGGVLLEQTGDEDSIETADVQQIKLPEPPKPPGGRWIQEKNAFESLIGNARRYDAFSTYSNDDIFKGLHGLYPIPKRVLKRDKHAFYWKPGRPSIPTTSWIFECDEFRHQVNPEVFDVTLLVPPGEQLDNCVFKCRITARNLRVPIVYKIPIKINYINMDIVATAGRFLEELKI
ncbi:MAG: PIN domain-containing protein [bacterium]